MLYQHNLCRSQQLLANHNGANSVDSRSAGLDNSYQPPLSPLKYLTYPPLEADERGGKREKTYIADNMRITKPNPKRRGRVNTSVHAGEDEVFLSRGQGEMSLGEGGRVRLGSGFNVLLDGGHGFLFVGVKIQGRAKCWCVREMV